MFVAGAKSPTPHEWNAYLADLARFSDRPFGLLVLVDCGLPSNQTSSGFQVVADASVDYPVSVVSSEEAVRETVEVFIWLGANVRLFPPTAVMAAMDFIGVPRAKVPIVWSRARALERLVEGGRVNAIALADPFVRTMDQESARP
jgi:hypothetical protein